VWYTKLDGTTMAMKRHMRQRTLTSLVDMGMTPAPQLDDPASRPMHVAIIPCAACLPPPLCAPSTNARCSTGLPGCLLPRARGRASPIGRRVCPAASLRHHPAVARVGPVTEGHPALPAAAAAAV
jgi:hypothetical protein